MVAKIDEEHIGMLARPVHPTRKTDFLADVGGAKVGASVGTIGVHYVRLSNVRGGAPENAPIWPRLRQVAGAFVKGGPAIRPERRRRCPCDEQR
jgi:hypothetical protein